MHLISDAYICTQHYCNFVDFWQGILATHGESLQELSWRYALKNMSVNNERTQPTQMWNYLVRGFENNIEYFKEHVLSLFTRKSPFRLPYPFIKHFTVSCGRHNASSQHTDVYTLFRNHLIHFWLGILLRNNTSCNSANMCPVVNCGMIAGLVLDST